MWRNATLFCLAVATLARSERLPVRTYTTADGLPHDSVNCIRRDSHGYLWFGTAEGLARFDGHRFVTYGVDRGMPEGPVNDLVEARDGTYWIATEGAGVSHFRPSAGAASFSVHRFDGQPAANRVKCLYEESNGRLWAGTEAGLYAWESGGFISTGLRNIRVFAILRDRQGALWIGAHDGLYRQTGAGAIEHYSAANGLHGSTMALLQDRADRIWAGTEYGVVSLVSDPDPSRSIVAQKPGPGERWGKHVFAMLEMSDRRIWVSSLEGLGLFDGPRFHAYGPANGLSAPSPRALAEDRDGNLWIGTPANGVMKLSRGGFTSFHEADGLAADTTYSIFADRSGRPCTISGGLTTLFVNCLDGGRFTSVHPNTPKATRYFGWGTHQNTFQDHAGEWWVATGQGLYRFPRAARSDLLAHARPKAVYTTSSGLAGNDVFRLYEDSRGDIWISTIDGGGGLVRWDRAHNQFHKYARQNAIQRNLAATAFCEDRGGNLWVSFFLGGLARYRDGRFTFFTAADGAPARWIESLYVDHSGRLWIASYSGVSRVEDPAADHPRFATYTTADGLASNSILAITEDRWGRIYAGSARGLDRFDPSKPLQPGRVVHYTVADGLASNLVQVAFRDRDGAIWAGSQHSGLSRVVPEPEWTSSPPEIAIAALRIAGASQAIPEFGQTMIAGLRLAPQQNRLEIEFGGISFIPGQPPRYQYTLEGADKSWSAPTDQRTINYANLAPGSYRFLVRAIGSDGAESPIPASLAFTIDPPLWRRWWFLVLAAFAAAAPVVAAHRYRLARVLELERVRTRIATDLHDDIGSSLSQVALLSEVVRRQVNGCDARLSEPLERIGVVSRELVDAMSDIVWAINPHRDRCSDLVQRMRRFATDVFTACDIQFQFQTHGAVEEIRLMTDTRRQVYLIFKESIHNIARHSHCTATWVDLRAEGDRLVLRIRDDGTGFAPGLAVNGHGLASMRARSEVLKGELEMYPEPGRGTSIVLRVPIRGYLNRWRPRRMFGVSS